MAENTKEAGMPKRLLPKYDADDFDNFVTSMVGPVKDGTKPTFGPPSMRMNPEQAMKFIDVLRKKLTEAYADDDVEKHNAVNMLLDQLAENLPQMDTGAVHADSYHDAAGAPAPRRIEMEQAGSARQDAMNQIRSMVNGNKPQF